MSRAGVIAGMSAVLLLCTAAPASASCPDETARVADTPVAQLRDAIVCLANEARGLWGLAPLVVDARLTSAAQAHADDMQARGYFAHQHEFGPILPTRLARAGYSPGAYGETIGWGHSTPIAMTQAWLRSPSHCATLLGPFTDVGVGVSAKPYWVQDFGVIQGAPSGTGGGPCGAGTADSAQPATIPPPVTPRGPTIARIQMLSRRPLRVSVACPAGRAPCAGSVRVRDRRTGTLLGSTAFADIASGGTRAVAVRLRPSDTRPARRRGWRSWRPLSRRAVRVEVASSGSPGDARTVRLPAGA